jgi:hypothetical protein
MYGKGKLSVRTRCYPKGDHVPVFAKGQALPTKINITLSDAEHAYYVCNNVPDQYKEECYLTFGVDRRKTEQYLQVVQKLEEVYHKPTLKEIIINTIEKIYENVMLIITFIRMMLA